MADSNPNRHEVPQEDVERLDRLSEEVRGRLAEIGMIVARIAGDGRGASAVVSFVPREAQRVAVEAAAPGGDWMEIVDTPTGNYCYGSIGGHNFMDCPCGGSGPP